MKRSFRRFNWALAVVAAVLVTSLSGLAAKAAGEEYVFVYPNDNGTVSAINEKLGEDDPPSQAKNTFLYAKGGFWDRLGGGKPVKIAYNSELSQRGNDSAPFDDDQGPSGEDDDQFIFSTDYLCYGNGADLEADQSKLGSLRQSLYYVSVGVVVELGSSGDFSTRDPFKASIFPLFVKKYSEYSTADERAGKKRNVDINYVGDYELATGQEPLDDDTYGSRAPNEKIDGSKRHSGGNFTDQVTGMLSDSGIRGGCYMPHSTDYQQNVDNYHKNLDKWQAATDEIDAAGGIEAAAGNNDPGGSGTSTNCAGGAMGWLFCPLINYMAKTIQAIANIIDNLLVVKFLSTESGGQNIEQIWRVMLSVANIMLVIAFMFIIFSQSTSLGLSNYGIKRMLPRLIIAAILMNLSFYICALAIDFSNIIGGSIMGFLLGSGNSISSSVTSATGGASGSLLGGAVAGLAIVGIMFFFLTPVVLSIFAILVILIGRHVILLVLVLVSPLAFVAWLLPNTEKYFKKWGQLFFQMLIVYPIIMLMFGAALLLSNVIGASGSDVNLTGGG